MSKGLPTCPHCFTAMEERLCLGWLKHFRCPRWHATEGCYELMGETPTGVNCRGCVPLGPAKDECPVCKGGLNVCSVEADHVVCAVCHVCWTSASNAPALERCLACGGSGTRPPEEQQKSAA